MTDVLLKLFGISARGAGQLTRTEVQFHGIHPGWVLLVAILLGAMVVWMYRRAAPDISPFRKYLMAALRGLFLLMLLGILLRPVLAVTFEEMVRRTLLVLVDTSGSMTRIPDRRSDEADLKRLALARDILDPVRGLNQPLPQNLAGATPSPRLDLVKAALKNSRLNLLPRLARDYDLAVYTFDDKLAEQSAAGWRMSAADPASFSSENPYPRLPAGWIDKLDAKGARTAIGDAVREVISQRRGQPLAGVLLVTDGANNGGRQPLEAAKMAAQDRVPLYIWGVGITAPKDIIIARDLFAPEVVFAKDDMAVGVRVRSMGMAGQSATLTVKLGDEKVEREVAFAADGEQVVTVTVTPRTRGDFELSASIAPRDEEVSRDNNATAQRIRVIDQKIKVLYVEQTPRWEFKYAQAALMRDRRVDFKCVLLEADKSVTSDKNSPFLAEFPRQKEELFKYDCLILGDVEPRAFSAEQIDNIHQFVSKFGGAMVMVAGKRSSPNAYRRTPLEKMLPIELETADVGLGNPANRPVRLELTAAGKSNLMLRIAERELDSAQKWAGLPPIYWVAKVARAKPAAEVLVVDPDPSKASRYGKMPVLASHQYGMGQVLYIGTDNFWRWRRNTGDRIHAMLWGQIVQRMALPHLLGASKRTQLSSDQKEYAAGSKVTVFARLYTEAFEPMTEPVVKGVLANTSKETAAQEVLLRAIPEQPGMYRGEAIANAVGAYQFSVVHDAPTKLEFNVTEPQQELLETAMNETLLRQMAQVSGRTDPDGKKVDGQFIREENLHALPDQISQKAERMRRTQEVEIWSTPVYFVIMLGLLTAEWVLRKLVQLK